MYEIKLFGMTKKVLTFVGLNTCFIVFQYKKPKEILLMEKEIQEEFKKLKASKDGDVDCTPS